MLELLSMHWTSWPEYICSECARVQALVAPGARGLTMKAGDVFDEAGPQTHWFANPFTLKTEPLMWRELQDAIRGCFERGLNTDDALLELRLRNPTSGAGSLHHSPDHLHLCALVFCMPLHPLRCINAAMPVCAGPNAELVAGICAACSGATKARVPSAHPHDIFITLIYRHRVADREAACGSGAPNGGVRTHPGIRHHRMVPQ